MHPFLVVPLAACAICSAFAIALLVRDPAAPQNRLGALLVAGTAWWAFCEVCWNLAPDAQTARLYLLLSTPGWCGLGPLVVNLFIETGRGEHPRLRRALPVLYLGSAFFFAAATGTNWVLGEMRPVPWGYDFVVGPLFPFYYLFTIACAAIALGLWMEGTPDDERSGEWRSRFPITMAILVPMVVASTTDGILPMLGAQSPRLGTASFAVLAGLVIWNNFRSGDYFGSPAAFAREILQTLPDGVALVSLNGRIRVVNEGLKRMLEVDEAELVGSRFTRWAPDARIEPECELVEHECELKDTSGGALPVALVSSALRDWQGRALGSVVVIRDLRELTNLRSRLVTSGRLAAVGQLAAGIAHEINNPIAFVRANLGQLREHWNRLAKELGPEAQGASLGGIVAEGEEIIEESLEGIDRAAGIVRDVREFSHAGAMERELSDLNELLDRVLRVATPELGQGVRVEKCYAELPLLESSPQQLKQVFLNLIVNAIHALDGNGEIRIVTESDARALHVHIEDDGCGIASEVRERIFDPFFTTKPVGRGMGLGLSISYEIVRSHGGELTARPRPGGGSIFSVSLPLS